MIRRIRMSRIIIRHIKIEEKRIRRITFWRIKINLLKSDYDSPYQNLRNNDSPYQNYSANDSRITKNLTRIRRIKIYATTIRRIKISAITIRRVKM